jgi:hypothetical protein
MKIEKVENIESVNIILSNKEEGEGESPCFGRTFPHSQISSVFQLFCSA